jgi:hypothetical protein
VCKEGERGEGAAEARVKGYRRTGVDEVEDASSVPQLRSVDDEPLG